MSLAKYNFQSWMKKGIGNAITKQDIPEGPFPAPAPGEPVRANVFLNTTINQTDSATKTFQIVGPADVIAFNKDLVIRTEPMNWNTNFPPNYLAHVEFYDEDLPWRYTPAKADGEKLRPWISLFVLEEKEFSRETTNVPLPQIKLLNNPPITPNTETWLWAHVQTILASSLANDQAQDHIISRLVCPRKLNANTAYYAFVIPSFESGRLAGLGRAAAEINAAGALTPSWGNGQDTFPVYYEWYFHTGNELDFEYLASLLKPQQCNEWVGRKPLDCTNPGFGIDAKMFSNPFMLYFEGALKSPKPPAGSTAITINEDGLTKFSGQLKQILDLANQTSGDPKVTPPFYGQKHIFEEKLLLPANGTGLWIHELNRDPRWRVPAGFGGEIMRRYQDHYMQKAWEQLETVVEANKIITTAKNILAVGKPLFDNHFKNLTGHQLNAITAPVHGKIFIKDTDGTDISLAQSYKESCFNGSVYGTGSRKLFSMRGNFRKKLEKNGELEIVKLSELIISKASQNTNILGNNPLAISKPIFQLKVKFNDEFSMSLRVRSINQNISTDLSGKVIDKAQNPLPGVAIYVKSTNTETKTNASGEFAISVSAGRQILIANCVGFNEREVDPQNQKNITIVMYRPGEDNKIMVTGITVDENHRPLTGVTISIKGTPTSTITDASGKIQINVTTGKEIFQCSCVGYITQNVPLQNQPDIEHVVIVMLGNHSYYPNLSEGIDPADILNKFTNIVNTKAITVACKATPDFHAVEIDLLQTIPALLGKMLNMPIPGWFSDPVNIKPALAYPDFEDAMYEKLKELSAEWFMPNLHLLPNNCITLLESNWKFIESFMVGLNVAMNQEMLWRDYPTDERGSCFRQFWDVKGIRDLNVVNDPGHPKTATELEKERVQIVEKFKDIKPIDSWKNSATPRNQAGQDLGTHNNRAGSVKSNQVVLALRGDLLKNFPNLSVYAAKATKTGNTLLIDQDPNKAETKFPLFKAEAGADIKLLGFDLSIAEAIGQSTPEDYGWFFILQETPGETRFGLDMNAPIQDPDHPRQFTWDDASWKLVDGPYVSGTANAAAHAEIHDTKAIWGNSSADMAYILFQKPVMIVIHAKEMLKDLDKKDNKK
jgi:hypothetical protein